MDKEQGCFNLEIIMINFTLILLHRKSAPITHMPLFAVQTWNKDFLTLNEQASPLVRIYIFY